MENSFGREDTNRASADSTGLVSSTPSQAQAAFLQTQQQPEAVQNAARASVFTGGSGGTYKTIDGQVFQKSGNYRDIYGNFSQVNGNYRDINGNVSQKSSYRGFEPANNIERAKQAINRVDAWPTAQRIALANSLKVAKDAAVKRLNQLGIHAGNAVAPIDRAISDSGSAVGSAPDVSGSGVTVASAEGTSGSPTQWNGLFGENGILNGGASPKAGSEDASLKDAYDFWNGNFNA